MTTSKEAQVLKALQKLEPMKKRVTFFISEQSKSALATWCKKHGFTESGAVEEMIRATVPTQFFKEPK
jgi:hypothetical protein